MTVSELSPWPSGTDPAAHLCDEEQRLVTLASYAPSELFGDAELARLARFAAHLCDTPSATVTLVEAERQIFLASEGVTVSETPRSTSFCAHAMQKGELLIVPDATQDPRFAEFRLVTGEEHLRFYAGAPLISAEGAPLGALCVFDIVARPEGLTPVQREGLSVLAEAVKRRLLAHRQAGEATDAIRVSAQRLQSMIDSVPDIAWSAGPGARFDYVNARWRERTGLAAPRHIEDWRAVIHPDEFERTRPKFVDAIQQAKPFEDEWRMRQGDGSYRWVLSRAVPSTDDPETARWFGTLTDIDDATRLSKERELLAGELAHRIKNIFSVVMGLIALHARGDETHAVFAEALTDTIRALSRAQDFTLQINRIEEKDLKGLLDALMEPYGAPGANAVKISGDRVSFGARAATPLALVFHEMATNAAKYGALSEAEGTVDIRVSREVESATITWQETGGPTTQPPQSEGFGSRLMRMAIENQLGGAIESSWQATGLRAVITLPLGRLSD
ncbi:MAG: HWE histidine kinase domain-containing protein [Erythrobacter sp.]|uniref:sensor histidine kinase n=1 Tax=Erythrobacter sp. TaxID=1042 RepID=UPI00262DDB6F|nr:HWE histidine kinase domain-containing protein [Erythrobacter sp.]MDJ0978245.1 HWE histidine kinase domain-containing protein [Erythrobacter sp.]